MLFVCLPLSCSLTCFGVSFMDIVLCIPKETIFFATRSEFVAVGTRNSTSLLEDSVPTGRDAD